MLRSKKNSKRRITKWQNPRCITTVEQEIDQVFELTDRENKIYRCKYCEAQAKK